MRAFHVPARGMMNQQQFLQSSELRRWYELQLSRKEAASTSKQCHVERRAQNIGSTLATFAAAKPIQPAAHVEDEKGQSEHRCITNHTTLTANRRHSATNRRRSTFHFDPKPNRSTRSTLVGSTRSILLRADCTPLARYSCDRRLHSAPLARFHHAEASYLQFGDTLGNAAHPATLGCFSKLEQAWTHIRISPDGDAH